MWGKWPEVSFNLTPFLGKFPILAPSELFPGKFSPFPGVFPVGFNPKQRSPKQFPGANHLEFSLIY